MLQVYPAYLLCNRRKTLTGSPDPTYMQSANKPCMMPHHNISSGNNWHKYLPSAAVVVERLCFHRHLSFCSGGRCILACTGADTPGRHPRQTFPEVWSHPDCLEFLQCSPLIWVEAGFVPIISFSSHRKTQIDDYLRLIPQFAMVILWVYCEPLNSG